MNTQSIYGSVDRRTEPLVLAQQKQIPYFVPSIGQPEVEAVTEVLRSGWLTTGPKVNEFEREFSKYTGSRHSIAVNSATAALQLAFQSLGVGHGDEVLMPTMTFTSAAAVVIHLGARPVFVDCDAETLNLKAENLESKITLRTKVIAPMHYGGHPCAMDEILEIARRHDLPVIEDAAHALSAEYAGRKIGTIGDVTCFSFYANKAITTGEGGMITTNNDTLAKQMRLMSYHGINKDCATSTGSRRSWRYEVVAPGYKHNMSDIAAAIGIHQLARCDAFRAARQKCAQLYTEALNDIDSIRLPQSGPHVQHAWHLYAIQMDTERWRISRDELSDRLQSAGIGSSVHFMPLHLHPYYREALGYRPEDFPVAAAAYERILSLPIFPNLSADDIGYIVDTIATLAREFRR